ncbi:MAG: metal-sulfur cluster assembly factor [Gemmatimonadaceae bacterium]
MDLSGTTPPTEPTAPASAPASATASAGDPVAVPATPAFDASEPPPTVDQVKMALRRVKDPDLNLNIIDLGLVYEIAVDDRAVKVDMSLTSPACPSGPQLMGDAERAARAIPGVADVTVNLVWSPLWSPDRIEPRVRAYLGF